MKSWFKTLLGGLAALILLPALALAQSPVLSVQVTSPANESSSVYTPGAQQAYATAVLTGGSITGWSATGGSGYSTGDSLAVTISGGGGTGATFTATPKADGSVEVKMTNAGSGYISIPTVIVSGGSNTSAVAPVITISSVSAVKLSSIDMIPGGYGAGYSTVPKVTISGGGGSGATATAVISNGIVTNVILNTPGSGYVTAPTVTIDPPQGVINIMIQVSGNNDTTARPYNTVVYVNGAMVGKGTHDSPLLYVGWTPPRPGVYYVSAVTTDNLGNKAVSNPVRFFVTGTAILSPEQNTLVPMGSSAIITADATVASGFIKSISFYKTASAITDISQLSGVTPYATDGTAPYTCSYSATASDPAINYITAVATDNNGSTLAPSFSLRLENVTPIGSLPSVSIVNPVDGSTVSAGTATKVVVDAKDTDGYIAKVEFYLNGNLIDTVTAFPYLTTWTPTVAGKNKLEAIAYDDKANAVKSDASYITVTAGLPTGEITSPLPGSAPVIKGTTVPVTVRAAGSDGGLGNLSTVELLIDGNITGKLPKGTNPDGSSAPLEDPLTFSWTANVSVGLHKITARITDKSGISINTAEVEVNVIDNQAPVIAITSPVTASSVAVGQSVTINATASDPDGAIASVDFYVNSTKVASVTNYPYTTSYRPATAGTYTIQAIATDNLGKTTQSSPVVISVAPPIGSAPLISFSINNPAVDYVAPGGTPPAVTSPIQVDMGSTLLLSASALDSDGTVTKVQFYANGTLIGTSTSAPYTMTLNLSDYGTLQLVAVATDNDGNRAASDPIDIEVLPQIGIADLWVKLQNPINGQAYVRGEQITFSATSNVGDSKSVKMDIYLNGQLWHTMSAQPFTYTVGIANSGHYEVRAVIRDQTSTVVSSPVYIDIIENRPPTVSITKPSNGTVVKAGATVNLEASAKDSDGTISKVEYYANGNSIGSLTSAPYRLSWAPPSQGIYKLTAMATDNSGERTLSSIVVLLATDPTLGAGAGDVVYFSPDLPGNPFGQYAMVRAGGTTGLFFGQMPAYLDPTTKKTVSGPTRFFSGLTVDAAGRVSAANSADLSGYTTDGSATLTIKDALNVATPVILSIPAGSTSIPAAYYTASVDGNADLHVVALTSSDARVAFALVKDGKADIGFSTLMSDGTIGSKTSGMTTLGGTTIKGKFDFANGLMTATLSGTYTGTAYGSPADGIAFSDGTLYNLSSRGKISDNNPMVAGFVVSGTESKNILVRAIGPSLTAFGVTGASTDTRLDIYDSNNVRVAFNTDWAGSPVLAAAMSQVGAFSLNSASKDAVVLSMLKPGAYTAMVTGTAGAALVELYDVDSISPYSPKRLLNISTRALVEANGTLNAGFMVGGYASKRVLIRAVGPGLSAYGVSGAMADPVLKLYRQSGNTQTLIRFNDNWQAGNDNDLLVGATQLVGAFPLGTGSKDAAILISLMPGTYSAVLSSATGAAGTALVEVYEVTTPEGQ
jgi:hypothetical protein